MTRLEMHCITNLTVAPVVLLTVVGCLCVAFVFVFIFVFRIGGKGRSNGGWGDRHKQRTEAAEPLE